MTSLLKSAQAFYRLSQDILTPVKSAAEQALQPVQARMPSPQDATIKTVSVIDKQVKIDIHLSDQAAKLTNRSELTQLMQFAISKVDPSLQIIVTLDMSTNFTISGSTSFRRRLNKKLAQDASTNVQATIEESLKGIPGSTLSNVSIVGLQVQAEITVPEQHSFTASQLGDTLTKAIQSVLPGGKVSVVLNFQTKTASRRKSAQDAKAAAEAAVIAAVSRIKGFDVKSFIFQPETKHVLVEIGKPADSQITAQQLSTFLTGKLQAVAPGFSAVATATTSP